MAIAKTREQQEADWWEDWWAADYSWDGLATKIIAGTSGLHGERTLQEYWLTDPATGHLRSEQNLLAVGEIIEAPDGSRWHIAHMPLFWTDGSAAKSAWTNTERACLATVIGARIAAANNTSVILSVLGDERVKGIDGRAQLQGSVLTGQPSHPNGASAPLHIAASMCWLPAWNAAKHQFGPGAQFLSANFSADTRFDSAIFYGSVSFDNVTFSGDASFKNTNFSGAASFKRATFFGVTRFYRATFSGNAHFKSARFSGDARFTSATISGEANFDNTIFSGHANLNSVTFSGKANFDSASFSGDARFYNATFSDDASFHSAIFSGGARFNDTTISGDATFSSANFSGNARFNPTTFLGNARFYRAFFSGHANLNSAIFSGDSSFNFATFAGGARFHRAKFEKSAFFRGSKFEYKDVDNVKSGQMWFGKAVFSGPLNFDDAVFASNPAHHSAAFLGARFADLASFRGCGDHWVAALDEVEIKGRILIDEREETDSLRNFDLVILSRARDGGENPTTKESLLKELEGGCRTLKVAMGAARNEIMEQRYYRLQLRTRREQAEVPPSERLVSFLFGWTADYGLSSTRPLVGLGLLMLVFTYIHAMFWHATGSFDGSGFIKSIEMAASRMFPFGAFEFVSRDWFNQLACRGAYPYTLLFARLFASLQSLIALLLIFLFGLSVRRRFKVGE